MKEKEYHVANFATFIYKTPIPPPPKKKKWMNLISNRLSTASVKYLNWPSPVFGQFQNGCNKVVIEPSVVQFWSKIILVIQITRIISAQIALHSVQLPLFIHITFLLDIVSVLSVEFCLGHSCELEG